MLNVAKGELLPHTPDYFATGIPDFDYDPEATRDGNQARHQLRQRGELAAGP